VGLVLPGRMCGHGHPAAGPGQPLPGCVAGRRGLPMRQGYRRGEADMADKKNGAESRGEPGQAPKAKMTKLEAVRRALAELGDKAKRAEIKDFVKERFGIEMSADHISTSKGEVLRKAEKAKKPAPRPPAKKEEARRPQPQEAPPARAGGGIAL